jgi:hypothetical protein
MNVTAAWVYYLLYLNIYQILSKPCEKNVLSFYFSSFIYERQVNARQWTMGYPGLNSYKVMLMIIMFVGFEVLTTVVMKSSVVWQITPCS